jgi:hypothetical protein
LHIRRGDCPYPIRDGIPVLVIDQATSHPGDTDPEFNHEPGFGWDVGDSFRQAGFRGYLQLIEARKG